MALVTDPAALAGPNERRARPRRYLLCPPRFFAVSYEINPWMDVDRPCDPELARAQWSEVRATYERLGHQVDVLPPVPGLPDLVFTANAGLVVDGRVLVSRFRYPERSGEEPVFLAWFHEHGFDAVAARWPNEGEGDLLVTRDLVLAGHGFRTDRRAHRELEAFAGRPVLSLELVDPRWYHLDTALAVLDEEDGTIAYFPGAFSPMSRLLLAEHFPDAVLATEADALAFGLNACSDGRHVVLAPGATHLADQLAARGFEPILVDTSELQKAGGSVKCTTLEVRS
jgi:N-dimethylarginine dimethylaminohydrolase